VIFYVIIFFPDTLCINDIMLAYVTCVNLIIVESKHENEHFWPAFYPFWSVKYTKFKNFHKKYYIKIHNFHENSNV